MNRYILYIYIYTVLNSVYPVYRLKFAKNMFAWIFLDTLNPESLCLYLYV